MMRERRFRFGLYADKSCSVRDLRDLSHRAESLGFSTLVLGDHFSGQLAPFSMLATVAAVTTRLRIGSLVFCNEFRHPAVLAKECATLDVLSEGRLEVGIGAGWNAAEFAATDIPFRPARVRVARVEEAVDILRGLWSNDTFPTPASITRSATHALTQSPGNGRIRRSCCRAAAGA
jgi:alkanesulfonate monooxygenase SsuD/methylene tetrahydromethanopterin reductase-like flavin-dependent oxidoreductase (luciferase family)